MSGRLWELIENHRNSQPYPPSYRQIAYRLGVSPSTVTNWKNPKVLPDREHLEALAKLVGLDYPTVLTIALGDTRYLSDITRDSDEVDKVTLAMVKSAKRLRPRDSATPDRSRQ